MQHGAQPDFQIACPVCSVFHSADFRLCPHCGYVLGAPHIVERPLAQRRPRGRFARPLVFLLILAVGVEAGLVAFLWQRTSPSRPNPAAPLALVGDAFQPDTAPEDVRPASRKVFPDARSAVATVTLPLQINTAIPQALSQPTSDPVQVPLTPLETPTQTPAEGTLGEQRYLAEHHARAQRWDEAIAHWTRAIEVDPSLRREIQSALGDAFLKSSEMALAEGRHADAHARLLEAVEWLPERGDVRVRLAESFAELGDYRTAIDQYWTALDLLPSQAGDLTTAVVRVYRKWGNELLRQGHATAAANMFREALQLDNSDGELYFALGKAEFRRQALDAAIWAFEAAQAHEPGLRSEVGLYLTRAQALLGGPQTAVINFPPGSMRIEVPVVINGRMEVPFIVDTGASVTLIPAWAADMLGYRAQTVAGWVWIQTAGGPRRLPYATVSRLGVQGLGLSNLPVVFGDLPGYEVGKGLLGMDFLRHFSLALDHEIGRLTLRPR